MQHLLKIVRKLRHYMEKYSRDELILEAETLKNCGEYLHMDLIGYSVDELIEEAYGRKFK